MEKGWGEGMYPQGQAVLLDSPGWDYIHGEPAAHAGGRPPNPGKANPVFGWAEPLVTSQRPPLCLAERVDESLEATGGEGLVWVR